MKIISDNNPDNKLGWCFINTPRVKDMETIRDQIKDVCIKNGISVEMACDIADDLGFDGNIGDLKINLFDAVCIAKDNR